VDEAVFEVACSGNVAMKNILPYLLFLHLLGWSSRSVAQGSFWEQTNGPFGLTSGEEVLAIASDSIGHMYLSTFNPTKTYTTTNEGEDWFETTSIGTEAYGLATDSAANVFAATFQGVFRSTDYGATWTQHTDGLSTTETDHIAILSNGDLLVGTWYGGVFRSSDHGEHWVQSGLAGAIHVEGIFAGPAGLVFATAYPTASDLYRSTDYGNSWTSWPMLPHGGSSLAFDSFGRIFASAWHGPAWVSSDGGVTWDSIGIGLPGYVRGSSIYVAPNDDVFLVMDQYGIYRTTNVGNSWVRVDRRTARNSGTTSITWTPSQNLAIAANILGVLRSENFGTVWRMKSKGLGFTTVTALVDEPAGFVYAGTGTGVLVSSDKGICWIQPDTGWAPLSGNGFFRDSLGNIFVAAPGGFFKSTDHGVSWFGYGIGSATGYFITESRLHTLLGAGWYYSVPDLISYAVIYRSVDGGTTWSVSLVDAGSDPIRFLAEVGNTLFAGYFRSTDDGLTWQKEPSGTSFYVTALVQNRLGDYLVGVVDSIYESTDAGITWSPMVSFGANVNAMAEDSTGVIYVGTNGRGVFVSTDDGVSWQETSIGLEDSVVLSLAYSTDHYVWCGTATHGVFRTTEPVTRVLSEYRCGPVRFNLEQNYPNPFNPVTSIEYAVGGIGGQGLGASNVRLVVYDLIGREVAVLVNERKAPGRYEVKFDASGLASGVYFYTLQAGDFVQSKKLVLLR
jgi:photosystem II stability/assembly factor-like uncharacterized protein